MTKLPSQEDLEKLYQKQGHEALARYILRNALRVLIVSLGKFSFESVWPKSTLFHVYMMCRPCLILALWVSQRTALSSSEIAAAAARVEDTLRFTAEKTRYEHVQAVVSVMRSVANYTAHIAYADAAIKADSIEECAGYYAASDSIILDGVDFDGYISSDEKEIFVNQSVLGFADIEMTNSEVAAAAQADYEWLNKSDCTIDEPSLWHSSNVKEVITFMQQFNRNLSDLGLGFLSDDFNILCDKKVLGLHAKNYLKEYSSVEIKDPVALQRLIMGKIPAAYIHAVRTLLIGPGGAGKSSLADRLQSKPISQTKKITIGVDYLNHQPLNLYENFSSLKQGEKPLSLYLWDFGGQTIFHGLHSAFLHENCVYVLVVDSRHEQAPDEWLHQIRHLAGSQAKVLLVTNWYEACETRQNEARLLREFPDLLDKRSFFYFSCHEPEVTDDFPNFVTALEQASLASQRMVLKETLDVNEALQQRYQNDVFLESVDLDEIIEQVTQRTETVETLPNKLEQLGFLVRVDSDDQRYCLKPAWAVDHAYAVLYSSTLREAKGVLQLKALQRDFKDKIDAQHTAYLVEFLQTRSLCRKLPNGGGYFFPDAASADELPEASELLANTSSLVIRFELPYLPLGFHAALVYRLFTPGGITTPDDIWRQGFILRKNTSRAVVHYLSRKSIIEMALVGAWQDFSALLNALLVNMRAVLTEGKGGISEEQIHPSVVLDRHVFSVHSGERLVGVLGQINSYEQLIHEVKAMTNTVHNEYHERVYNTEVKGDGQNAIGSEHITMNQFLAKSSMQVTADQRQIISSVLDEVLKNKASLSNTDLRTIFRIQDVIEADSSQPTPDTQSKLNQIWKSLPESADFTNNVLEIGSKVAGSWPAITGWIAATGSFLGG